MFRHLGSRKTNHFFALIENKTILRSEIEMQVSQIFLGVPIWGVLIEQLLLIFDHKI